MKNRILVVDDDESIRELFECIIEDMGYECDTAENGEEGIKAIENETYKLVFLDIKMPKINGIEALKKIKALKPEIPVIMMTGFSVDDLVNEAKNLKAEDVLYKPFDVETLETLIKEKTK